MLRHNIDNLINKLCESVFNNDNLVMICIKFANINILFLAAFSKHILVFVRAKKWKSTATFWFERVLFTIT